MNAKQLRLKLVHAGTATVFQNWPAVKTPLNRVGISKHAKDFILLEALKPDSNPNPVANVRHQCLTSQSTAFWRSEMKLAEQAASDLCGNKPNKSVHLIQCDLAGASLSPEALH